MRLSELRERLDDRISKLPEDRRELLLQQETSYRAVHPFNEFELRVALLLANHALSIGEYLTLRADYVAANRYLDLFPLAPRIFGQVWAQEHLKSLDPRLQTASRVLDPEFSGAYDLWVNGARIEVKAGRAIRKTGKKELADIVRRALRHGEPGTFWMNFQQLKPDYCDVFVFIGVWVDRIRYWVLSPHDAASNPYYSHQH